MLCGKQKNTYFTNVSSLHPCQIRKYKMTAVTYKNASVAYGWTDRQTGFTIYPLTGNEVLWIKVQMLV